jgi:hypothetical protein
LKRKNSAGKSFSQRFRFPIAKVFLIPGSCKFQK